MVKKESKCVLCELDKWKRFAIIRKRIRMIFGSNSRCRDSLVYAYQVGYLSWRYYWYGWQILSLAASFERVIWPYIGRQGNVDADVARHA
ncbi:hypothetical protein RJT34_03227 [Clitoria ternatea]|uniref:Uncharacterized protein n=1 Tax=Clitoria ternatea TaxID=43366 RepID=A0AAN9KJX4_CLITE